MTSTQAPESRARLTGELLKSVSRSFYLSLRLLPAGLRAPVSLAYLLARATDTLADTVRVPVGMRLENLRSLAAAVTGNGIADETSSSLPHQSREQRKHGRDELVSSGAYADFARLQTDIAERELVTRIPDCLRELAQLPAFDRSQIDIVLGKITQAQELDLERFRDGTEARALQSAPELDEYTYLIAGCVGEFWSEMCFHHLHGFAEFPPEEMRELGREYGCGLQLVNILRDAQADLRAGRCYLPADELKNAGVSPSEILNQPEAAFPVVEKWLTKAEIGLNAGMKYVSAIKHRRVRLATALPALIGIRTIKELRAAGPRVFQEKIKIPRSEVRAILLRASLAMGAPGTLRKMFERGKG